MDIFAPFELFVVSEIDGDGLLGRDGPEFLVGTDPGLTRQFWGSVFGGDGPGSDPFLWFRPDPFLWFPRLELVWRLRVKKKTPAVAEVFWKKKG
jgi:hypothetical protein